MLSVSGLLHRFPGSAADQRPAVDVSGLTVPAGRFLAVTGPSGSGKTTLLYLLSGLMRPSAGRIDWDGVDIAVLTESQRDAWRREWAGFVFQNFNLIDEMSAYQNVTVAAHFAAFTDRAVRDRAEALLDRYGVPDGRRSVVTYSRGEQQRIALARALLFDPPILFADEPTASLDTVSSAAMAEQFQALASAGKTVIVVSHDPIIIEAAERVLRLDHGQMIAEPASAAA
jgi:putative ABC transport system ATP-binding protein